MTGGQEREGAGSREPVLGSVAAAVVIEQGPWGALAFAVSLSELSLPGLPGACKTVPHLVQAPA